MLNQIMLGSLLVIITTIIHAIVTIIATSVLRADRVKRFELHSRSNGIFVVAGLVLLMFVTALIEVTIWAMTFVQVGAISEIETALYFSMVTFTTLGYGEIVLNEDARLLASFAAANGIIMFGWTTALIFAFIQRLISLEGAKERQ